MGKLNSAELQRFVDTAWEHSIVPELCNYVRIPNKSPLFDPAWEQHGHMEKAVAAPGELVPPAAPARE